MSMNPVTEATVGAAYNNYAKPMEKSKTKESEKTTVEKDAVYEKSTTEKKATYSINKMSKEDRACLVQQMQEEQQSIKDNFIDMRSNSTDSGGAYRIL